MYMIGFRDNYFKDADKPILKDLLKLILLNDYQKAYDAIFEKWAKAPGWDDVKLTCDGLTVQIRRENGGMFIMIYSPDGKRLGHY